MTSHYRENPVTDSDLIVIVLYSVDITGNILLMWKLIHDVLIIKKNFILILTVFLDCMLIEQELLK